MEIGPTVTIIEAESLQSQPQGVFSRFGSPGAALAGGFCGMCVDLLLHPIDTMKTRMQSMARGTRTFRAVVGPSWRSTTVGVFTNLAAFPSGCAYFGVYETVKTWAESVLESKSHIFLAHLVAGSMAEVSSIIVR